MPKMKSRKGVTKRFRITSSGLVKRKRAGQRHLLGKKKPGRKRQNRQGAYIPEVMEKQIKMMMQG